jgi:hypothetical protein
VTNRAKMVARTERRLAEQRRSSQADRARVAREMAERLALFDRVATMTPEDFEALRGDRTRRPGRSGPRCSRGSGARKIGSSGAIDDIDIDTGTTGATRHAEEGDR